MLIYFWSLVSEEKGFQFLYFLEMHHLGQNRVRKFGIIIVSRVVFLYELVLNSKA